MFLRSTFFGVKTIFWVRLSDHIALVTPLLILLLTGRSHVICMCGTILLFFWFSLFCMIHIINDWGATIVYLDLFEKLYMFANLYTFEKRYLRVFGGKRLLSPKLANWLGNLLKNFCLHLIRDAFFFHWIFLALKLSIEDNTQAKERDNISDFDFIWLKQEKCNFGAPTLGHICSMP